MFASDSVRPTLTSLRGREKDDPIELVDAAYWMKGCSSLGRLRYAALLRIGQGKSSSLCLVDVKEGVNAAAPSAAKVEMSRDNAVRVVTGAMLETFTSGCHNLAARSAQSFALSLYILLLQSLGHATPQSARPRALPPPYAQWRCSKQHGFTLAAAARGFDDEKQTK
jgi:hypothetical protein